MTSQYFIGDMMPELANPVRQSLTVIEIRPFKGGWQCYESPFNPLRKDSPLPIRANRPTQS